jgi:hypothetical protein
MSSVLLFLCFVAVDWTRTFHAHAQDVEVSDVVVEDGDVADSAVETEDDGTEVADDQPAANLTEDEQAAAYADSIKDLGSKLETLQHLLSEKGDVDPAMQERLKGLKSQLQGLGLDFNDGPKVDKGMTELMGGCMTMSLKRIGIRPSSIGALRQLAADKLSQKEGSILEMIRMVAVCINELTMDDLKLFKRGKLEKLPKTIVDAAKGSEGEKQVLDFDAQMWESLKVVADAIVKQYAGQDSTTLPVWYGVVAFVPFAAVIGVLVKKFLETQHQTEKKDKRGRKRSKSQ